MPRPLVEREQDREWSPHYEVKHRCLALNGTPNWVSAHSG